MGEIKKGLRTVSAEGLFLKLDQLVRYFYLQLISRIALKYAEALQENCWISKEILLALSIYRTQVNLGSDLWVRMSLRETPC